MESRYYEKSSEVWCFVFVTNGSVVTEMDRNSLFETGQKVWRSCVRQILDLKKKPSSSRSAWCSFEMMKKKCEHVFRFLDGSASYGICDQIFICSSMNRRSLRRNRSHENTPKMETGIRKTNHHVTYEPCPKLLSLSLELELWQFHKSMRAGAKWRIQLHTDRSRQQNLPS